MLQVVILDLDVHLLCLLMELRFQVRGVINWIILYLILKTFSINSDNSGRRVAIVFLNLSFEKIEKFRTKVLGDRMIQKVEGLF